MPMEVQTYQHNDVAPAPWPMRWLAVGAIVSIILLIALPVMMLIDRDGVIVAIMRQGQQLDTANREWLVAHPDMVFGFVMIYTVVLHLVCAGVLGWFTPKAVRGCSWARIGLSIYLVAATCLSLISAVQGGMFLAIVIPTDIIHILMLVLLWVPPSVRQFYAAHRSVRRSTPTIEGAVS